MAVFVEDTFTDTDGTLLTAHTGETGATWTLASGTDAARIDVNRVNNGTGSGVRWWTASGVPATAEYDVEGIFRVLTLIRAGGLMGRVVNDADHYRWQLAAGAGEWQLVRRVASVETVLGTFAQTFAADTDYAAVLELRDAAKKGYVDGVERVSSEDNTLTVKGLAGVWFNAGGSPTVAVNLDSITATEEGAAGGSTTHTRMMMGIGA